MSGESEEYVEPDYDRDCCDACGGEGYYHDCGEDTCCCLHPDQDYLVTCDECGGYGYGLSGGATRDKRSD